MDNIVSIRKKIIKKETEEEFYLNSCDIFITGKIYEIESNLKTFYYLPFNEYLIVLFDDFISVFDIKKSIFENLKMVKQLKIREIYKYFFDEEISNEYFNLDEVNKVTSKETENHKNLKKSKEEINNEKISKGFFEENYNFKTYDQCKDIRFFNVSENTPDKSMIFYIEFHNRDLIIFGYDDPETDLFTNSTEEKNDGKNENRNGNVNNQKIEEIIENNQKPQGKEENLRRKTKRNYDEEEQEREGKKNNKPMKKKKYFKDPNSETSEYDSQNKDQQESDFNSESETSQFQKINKKNKGYSVTRKNKTKNSLDNQMEQETTMKDTNFKKASENNNNNNDVKQFKDLKIYLKLNQRNYFKHCKMSFHFCEDLKKKKFDGNSNKNQIYFGSNLLSYFDFNGNMKIIELYNKVDYNLTFISNFNCLFFNQIFIFENKNSIKVDPFKFSFDLFKSYKFNIIDFKIFSYKIYQNLNLIFIFLSNDLNNLLFEAYFLYFHKNGKFNFIFLESTELIFSNYHIENLNLFDPSIISEINVHLEKTDNINTFWIFVTKLHAVFCYKLTINKDVFLEKLNNFLTTNNSDNFTPHIYQSLYNGNNRNISLKTINIEFFLKIKFNGFEILQSQIRNTFYMKGFIYCFDIKGNYSFIYFSDIINSKRNIPEKLIEIQNVKELSLCREIYEIIPFFTETGFYILNSYNILKNQDFILNYFLPLNLQVLSNDSLSLNNRNLEKEFLILDNLNGKKNNLSFILLDEKEIKLTQNLCNLISEYLLRKLRISTKFDELFDYINNIIDSEIYNLYKNSNGSELKMTRKRLEYFLNKLKYKKNTLEEYKIIHSLKNIIEFFKKENKINEFGNEKSGKYCYETICEICYDVNLIYNNDEIGYICKNDHYTPCCCLTKIPLVIKSKNNDIEKIEFYKCNFCDIYYESTQVEYIKKFKKCVVCLNNLNIFQENLSD